MIIHQPIHSNSFALDCDIRAPVWEVEGAQFSETKVHTADGISIRFPRVIKVREDKDFSSHTTLDQLKKLTDLSPSNPNLSSAKREGEEGEGEDEEEEDEDEENEDEDDDEDEDEDEEMEEPDEEHEGKGKEKARKSPTKKSSAVYVEGPLMAFHAHSNEDAEEDSVPGYPNKV